ncbi:hypothetical protein GCM10010193_67900 [Kitasatospora atroaurantiaca]
MLSEGPISSVKPAAVASRADALTNEIGDLGAAGNGAARGFAGPAAAIRQQFATPGSTASGQALTRPSTPSANMA